METHWDPITPIDTKTGEVVDPSRGKTSPHHVMVQVKLDSGALASITLRKTMSCIDEHTVHWIISGSKGEI